MSAPEPIYIEAVEQRYVVDLAAPPTNVFPVLADLTHYRDLIGLIHKIEQDTDEATWIVTLRAKIGPLARSKRLRMRRTVCDAPHRVRFERDEVDGRSHSPWTLEATVEPGTSTGAGTDADASTTAESSTVTMVLAYGGSLWSPMLNTVLDSQVEQAKAKLQEMV